MANWSLILGDNEFNLSYELNYQHRNLNATRDLESLNIFIGMYREIQILIRLYNIIHQKWFFPCYIACALSNFIIWHYVVVAHHQDMGIIPTAVCTITSLMAQFAVLLCLQFPANDFSQSLISLKLCKSKAANLMQTSRANNIRLEVVRKIRSLAEVRIGFGGNNFIDKLTPLTVILFGVDKVVTLILLQ